MLKVVPKKSASKGAALASGKSGQKLEKNLFSEDNSAGSGGNLYPDADTNEAMSR